MKKIPSPITIWIHGTNPLEIFPHPISKLQINFLHKFMYCHPGLHKASSLEKSYHHFQIAESLSESNPAHFPWETLYFFGWSGKLRHEERLKAGHKLYKAIKQLVGEYEQHYKQKPDITIITHSHGGNVALNMAEFAPLLHHEIIIQNLILLACPVQKINAHTLKHPIFSQIHAFHSHWDFMQIADPQGWPELKEQLKQAFKAGPFETIKTAFNFIEQESLFSERHFHAHSKLTHVQITHNGRNIMHVQFMLPAFVKNITKILATLEDRRKEKGHEEGDILIDTKNY